jgi:hypothetical protein
MILATVFGRMHNETLNHAQGITIVGQKAAQGDVPMTFTARVFRLTAISSALTVVCLLVIPLAVTALTAFLIPSLPNRGMMTLFGTFLVGGIIGGAAWGYCLSRIGSFQRVGQLTLAGTIFGPSFCIAAIVLESIEGRLAVANRLNAPGIHTLFIITFWTAVFIVTAVPAFALGMALRDGPLARRLALISGIVAACAFLVVDLVMYLIGWQVGNPDFPDRPTMTTVMTIGLGVAALAGGAAIGYLVSKDPSGHPTSQERPSIKIV